MACPWSCACDPPSTPYQSRQQYKTILKTWRNNFEWEEGGQYYISQSNDQERFEVRDVVFSRECLNIFAMVETSLFFIFSLYDDIHITVRQLKYLITVKYNLWQTNNKSAAHEIQQVVRYESNGPGCFMGYRSMTRCLRFCFFFWKHWLNLMPPINSFNVFICQWRK